MKTTFQCGRRIAWRGKINTSLNRKETRPTCLGGDVKLGEALRELLVGEGAIFVQIQLFEEAHHSTLRMREEIWRKSKTQCRVKNARIHTHNRCPSTETQFLHLSCVPSSLSCRLDHLQLHLHSLPRPGTRTRGERTHVIDVVDEDLRLMDRRQGR